jgi:multidrug efflux pump subunit AcrA (membrane-fusion protein)
VSGLVVGLAAHTVGGVVQPGQTLMEIVPADDALIVEARFALNAGEKLAPGQGADLRFSGMDQVRTPVLQGTVLTVSADRLEDARSGEPYLLVRVAVPPGEHERLERSGTSLRAGLPVEVFVKLGERSLLAALLKPVRDRLAHAFTE